MPQPNPLSGSTWELLSDGAESWIDRSLDEGVLKELPLVKIGKAVLTECKGLRDRLFTQKVGRFLKVLASTDPTIRPALARLLGERGPDEFSTTVLMLIERADHLRKPVVLGRIWVRCAEGKVSARDAIRLSHIIDRVFWEDLMAFRGIARLRGNDDEDLLVRLFSVGLVRELRVVNMSGLSVGEITATSLGQFLLDFQVLEPAES